MKLSENLRSIRKENNLSQEQLAEKLGVSRQAVSKWESGQSYPEMDKVLLICKLFNYNIDELMNENIKEVNETKQSKININKYIDDFFGFITKTVDMFSTMKFRQQLKCLTEQFCVGVCLLVIFILIGVIASSVISGIFGKLPSDVYYVIRGILESIYTVLALVVGTMILLHIFKIRYLDYYEIVKEEGKEEENEPNNNDAQKQESYDEKKKIYIEKKKEKVIIRDPNHSGSKFLTGIFRIVLWCIKFITAFIGIGFVFSFVFLFALLVLSFMFVKAGLVFVGSLLGIISAIIINFIILESLYNFIISKKSKKTRMAICFIIALILAGIGIGTIGISITDFNYVETPYNDNLIQDVYEVKMKDNLLINTYNNYRYIETESDEIKIVVNHSKYYTTDFINHSNRIDVHCYRDDSNRMKIIKEIIADINNKEIKDYSTIPVVEIYTSKDNIKKLKKNEKNYYYENELIIVNN